MTMNDFKIVSIGDRDFTIRPLPALKAVGIIADIASGLSGITELMNALQSDGADGVTIDANKLDVQKIAAGIDGDKLEQLVDKLVFRFKNVVYDNQNLTPATANDLFAADAFGLIELAFEAVKINYGNFSLFVGRILKSAV